ncbi:MAG: anti-sigma factor family protein [Trebonia sp.]
MSKNLSMWRRMRGSADMASCREVGRGLQAYLDGHTDELTARRIARHLERCRRCGMEADIYAAIKTALVRQRHALDPAAVARLRDFGAHLLNDPPTVGG